ncbi:MAG: hypothetical protein HWE27_17300 [Gammaproteobacteria bacterium]|nr:hypothetical protein [Gammaproteobacteria bacterium]
MIQGELGLSIRAPESISLTQVSKLTPRQVSRWLDALPLANISDSSKRIYQLLVECNKSTLADDERFKILMAINPSVLHLLKSLSKHFTSHTLNLSDKQKKVAALVQAIHTEMAIGFKAIIESTSAKITIINKSMLHTSLFMALEYLSSTVLRCYQVYTDVPARLWKEINIIYRFALTQKLDTKNSQVEGFEKDHSILDVFKKICLLSIANPYQLRQQEIETIFNGLQRYVDFCSLELSNRFDNKFIVDLTSAYPPMHQALRKVRPSQFTQALNLDRVVEELQKNLKKAPPKVNENVTIGGLSDRLTRHLLNSWAHLSSRNSSRTNCDGDIRIAVGLSATHQLLNGIAKQEPNDTLERYEGSLHNATLVEDNLTAHMLASFGNNSVYQEPDEEDVWAKLYRPKQAIPNNQEVDYTKAFKKHNVQSHAKHEFVGAELKNISPGGYCIHLVQNPPLNTQAGEVIGLVESRNDDQDAWQIGVIRWLKRDKQNGGVQLGIQLIAPGAKAVNSKAKSPKQASQSQQKALLLPELKGVGQQTTLLTSPTGFTPQQTITIIDGEEQYEAKLTKLVSSTQGYRQFHFERLGGKTQVRSTQSLNLEDKDDGFDNVWDLI